MKILSVSLILKDQNRVGKVKKLLIISCSISSTLLSPAFLGTWYIWKEHVRVETEMNASEWMHWKIVGKYTHLTFFYLSSWHVRTEPRVTHKPRTGPLQSSDRRSLWFTAFFFSLWFCPSTAGDPLHLTPRYLMPSDCSLVAVNFFPPTWSSQKFPVF